MHDPIYPVNLVLQAVLLAGAAWLVVACLRGCERRARAGLLAVLVCGVMPFFTALIPLRATEPVRRVVRIHPLPIAETMTTVTLAEPLPVAVDSPPPAASVPERKTQWMAWALGIWLVGSAVGGFRIAREILRGGRWQRALAAPSDGDWEQIRSHLPLAWCRERIRVSNDPSGPCAIGFWQPRIVIPRWLLETHHPRELSWALRHEAEHLRCHDTRWIYLVRGIRAVQWWNPFLHRLVGVWALSREQACDLHATRHPAERPDYGHFLLRVASGERARLATWMAAKGELKRLRRRITTLMETRALKAAPAGPGWTLAMTMLMVVVGWGSSMVGFADPDASKAADGSPPTGDPSWLEPAPNVRLETAILITPEPFAAQSAVLTDTEAQAKLARWVGRKGVYFQSLSGISGLCGGTAPSGTPQSVLMTVSRDKLTSESPWDGSRTLSPFVGWVIHYQPTAAGAEVRLGVKAAYSFLPGLHPAPGLALKPGLPWDPGRNSNPLESPVLPVGMAWQDTVLSTADEMATIPPGRILCTSLGEVEKGVYAQYLTGVDMSMPWDYKSTVFAALRPPQREAETVNQVQMQSTTPTIEPSPAAKALHIELAELNRRLKAAVDANPANRELLELRAGLQARFDEAERKKDEKLRAELKWKIQVVTQRMADNATNAPGIAALEDELKLNQSKQVDEYRASLMEYYRTHPQKTPAPANR